MYCTYRAYTSLFQSNMPTEIVRPDVVYLFLAARSLLPAFLCLPDSSPRLRLDTPVLPVASPLKQVPPFRGLSLSKGTFACCCCCCCCCSIGTRTRLQNHPPQHQQGPD
jgi:hypothetical protein